MVLNHARNAAEIGDQVREKIREFAQRGLRALGVAITDDVTKPGNAHVSKSGITAHISSCLHYMTPGACPFSFSRLFVSCGQRSGVLQYTASSG